MPLTLDTVPVDSRAVPALLIDDTPVSVFQGQAAMAGRHVRKPQHNVAALVAADQKRLPEQRDRIAAPDGD